MGWKIASGCTKLRRRLYASKARLPIVPRASLPRRLPTVARMYTYAATAVISVVIGFAGAWQIQDARQHTKELENDQIRAAEALAAGNVSLTQAGAVIAALSAATVRNGGIRRSAADSAAVLDGLRKQSAAALQAASASLAACTSLGATQNIVFAECTKRLQEVAEDADAWASDAQLMVEAWPK